MADQASMGFLARMFVEPGDSPHAFDASSETYEFISESMAANEEIIETGGIRGTRQHASETVRKGVKRVSGNITLPATPKVLSSWMPRIVGGSTIAETLPYFGLMINKVGKVHTYTGCKVGIGTLSGGEGQGLSLSLDLIGTDELLDVPAPAIAIGFATEDKPLVFSDGTLKFGADSFNFTDFSLSIDNAVVPRIANSRTATAVNVTDLIVTLNVTLPYATAKEVGLYDGGMDGVSAELAFTNGDMGVVFNVSRLQFPRQTPPVGGSTAEVMHSISGVARTLEGVDCLTYTVDTTPEELP